MLFFAQVTGSKWLNEVKLSVDDNLTIDYPRRTGTRRHRRRRRRRWRRFVGLLIADIQRVVKVKRRVENERALARSLARIEPVESITRDNISHIHLWGGRRNDVTNANGNSPSMGHKRPGIVCYSAGEGLATLSRAADSPPLSIIVLINIFLSCARNRANRPGVSKRDERDNVHNAVFNLISRSQDRGTTRRSGRPFARPWGGSLPLEFLMSRPDNANARTE